MHLLTFFAAVRIWLADQLRRIRACRPSALDVVAILILSAYGILCFSTVFQSYRSYEEVWAFETDGPFYVGLLEQLVHGRLYPSQFYGYFPILAAYVFLLPVRLANYLFGSGDLITSVIIAFRLSQIFFVLLAGWLIYLVASSLSTQLLAIICLLSFFSISEVFRWTAFVHPDIQQLSMTLAGCYFLLKYMDSQNRKYFFASAIFAGLATASKFFGIFLVPAAAVAALAVCLPRSNATAAAMYQSARLTLLYAGIHTLAYLIATPPLIRRPLRSLRFMFGFHAGEDRVTLGNAFSIDLWQRKAALLFDNVFLGKAICAGFVIALIWTVAASIARRRIEGVHVLNAVIISFCIVFLALWGDVFNLDGGYRYLLQPVAMVPIVIAVALNDFGRRFGTPGRVAAVMAAFWALVIIIPSSLPLRAQRISNLLSFYWMREQTGQFLVRQWIEENVPSGSRILTQAYTNIAMPDWEPGQRWRGKKDIRIFYDPSNHVFITPKAVASIDPDFIFAISEKEAAEILVGFPAYQLVAKVGERGVVIVLQKGNRVER